MTASPLAGRVVLVTGAGRGLGRAHALACAALGAKVLVNDFDAASAEAAAEDIRALGGDAAAQPGDVANPDHAAAMVALAAHRLGGLHALVNNAGVLRDRSLLNMTIEEWTHVIDVHLRGAFVMTQAAGRYWRDRAKAGHSDAGRVINTTSGSGLFGNFGQANYSAAKGGLASLTVLTAIELGRYGVTANAIAPIARTAMLAQAPDAPAPADGFDVLDPGNISPLVGWLASARSAAVTGRIFSAIGGFVGVVEGYAMGPSLQQDRRLTFADLDAELPALVARARPRTAVRDSHPYHDAFSAPQLS